MPTGARVRNGNGIESGSLKGRLEKMKTDAEMPWPATAEEQDLRSLILEIKQKNDRIMQLLIIVIVLLIILLILIFVP